LYYFALIKVTFNRAMTPNNHIPLFGQGKRL